MGGGGGIKEEKTTHTHTQANTVERLDFFSLHSLFFCIICFMERLLQINIIGIHRRVLSPRRRNGRAREGGEGFYNFFFNSYVPPLPRHFSSPIFFSPLAIFFFFFTRYPVCFHRPHTHTHERYTARNPYIYIRVCYTFFHFFVPVFLEFFQWHPVLFHGLSLLRAASWARAARFRARGWESLQISPHHPLTGI